MYCMAQKKDLIEFDSAMGDSATEDRKVSGDSTEVNSDEELFLLTFYGKKINLLTMDLVQKMF